MNALVMAALLQVTPAPQQQLPASPIKRLVITPSPATMTAQDTLRLSAQALDAEGRVVPNVVFRYLPSSGARFEGRVTEDGLVRSGATGTLPITVTANIPGFAPVIERVEVVMLPAQPGRIEVQQPVKKLVVGQSVPISGQVFSIHGDARNDRITWRTSNAAVRISEGRLVGERAGRATITGTAGAASASF